MSANLIEAPPPNLSPDGYRRYIQNQIFFHAEKLLSCKKYVVFYSGPKFEAQEHMAWHAGSNNFRSKILASALNASRINNTLVAEFLSNQDLRSYFFEHLLEKHGDIDSVMEETNKAYTTVWGGPSELLAQRRFEKAATVVCGAGEDRVFVVDEMRPLLENASCKEINDVSLLAPKRMYFEVGAHDAFDLLCRSELRLVHNLAVTDIVNYSWWGQDFRERAAFYEAAQHGHKRKKPSAFQRRRKKEILQTFQIEGLYATAPGAWDCALRAGVRGAAMAPVLSLV